MQSFAQTVTDNRLTVSKIPFTATAEVVLRHKIKKKKITRPCYFLEVFYPNNKQSSLPHKIPRLKSLKSNCSRSLQNKDLLNGDISEKGAGSLYLLFRKFSVK